MFLIRICSCDVFESSSMRLIILGDVISFTDSGVTKNIKVAITASKTSSSSEESNDDTNVTPRLRRIYNLFIPSERTVLHKYNKCYITLAIICLPKHKLQRPPMPKRTNFGLLSDKALRNISITFSCLMYP